MTLARETAFANYTTAGSWNTHARSATVELPPGVFINYYLPLIPNPRNPTFAVLFWNNIAIHAEVAHNGC